MNKESKVFSFLHFFVAQAIQSLFPRLPDSGRGTSLFDRGTAAAGPEGDKLRLDTYPFLGSGEFKDSVLVEKIKVPPDQPDSSCSSSHHFLSLDVCTTDRVHLSLSVHLRSLYVHQNACPRADLKRQCVNRRAHMFTPDHTVVLRSYTPLPFFPSHPPMCPSCPNPFPGRKALIEGAGFGLWPVGAHYCVFISK